MPMRAEELIVKDLITFQFNSDPPIAFTNQEVVEDIEYISAEKQNLYTSETGISTTTASKQAEYWKFKLKYVDSQTIRKFVTVLKYLKNQAYSLVFTVLDYHSPFGQFPEVNSTTEFPEIQVFNAQFNSAVVKLEDDVSFDAQSRGLGRFAQEGIEIRVYRSKEIEIPVDPCSAMNALQFKGLSILPFFQLPGGELDRIRLEIDPTGPIASFSSPIIDGILTDGNGNIIDYMNPDLQSAYIDYTTQSQPINISSGTFIFKVATIPVILKTGDACTIVNFEQTNIQGSGDFSSADFSTSDFVTV